MVDVNRAQLGLVDLAAIRQFVQVDLGCNCPPEVFGNIQVGIPYLFGEPSADRVIELVIGARLMVSVRQCPVEDVVEFARKALVEGLAVRSSRGFNRYRLALVGAKEKSLDADLRELACEFDDRMHVHVLG